MNLGQIKSYKPITPSMRHVKTVNLSNLDRTEINFLSKPYKQSSGRNNKGRITVKGRGGGPKKNNKLIDFHYNQVGVPGIVVSVEFDCNRSSFINLIRYDNGFLSYRLNAHGIYAGDKFIITKNIRFDNGFSSELKFIPEGSYIYNVELRPDRGGSIARAAGVKSILLSKDRNKATLKLPSKEIIELSCNCKATIGVVSNIYHRDRSTGNFGKAKKKGRRPSVRGVAKNPIDHPHGGGEGKKSKRKDVVNFKGRLKRGQKTSRLYKHTILTNKINKILFQ
uniref:Ribosomal protein L12 n=1 Tax=Pharyngomonas kirbyi TaxID=63601 RepID=A0A1W6R261_9EUKA|nr:ribosomal protein L12 [Pharyngomonas kirbyi]ARO47978.1 ribosomal protein L12 [Pharyngomonas kirbyi]